MKVQELIEKLQQLPQDKSIVCQVVPFDPPGAWNMWFDVFDIQDSWMVQLRVWHPDLKKLPEFDTTPNVELTGEGKGSFTESSPKGRG